MAGKVANNFVALFMAKYTGNWADYSCEAMFDRITLIPMYKSTTVALKA